MCLSMRQRDNYVERRKWRWKRRKRRRRWKRKNNKKIEADDDELEDKKGERMETCFWFLFMELYLFIIIIICIFIHYFVCTTSKAEPIYNNEEYLSETLKIYHLKVYSNRVYTQMNNNEHCIVNKGKIWYNKIVNPTEANYKI